uniref:Uncharacterized protein n=1 Tax=Anguilla anguilla TaxID=7936 RepID=A0A0E9PQF3_ANGAN
MPPIKIMLMEMWTRVSITKIGQQALTLELLSPANVICDCNQIVKI